MSTPGAVRVWENSFAVYKRIWRSNLLGSFVQPLLYLLGMGIGVGTLVDEGPSSSEILGGVDYFAFLAPALLATTAMIVITQEAMWPVMDGFTWSNAYRAMAATPLRALDVAAGVSLWHATRCRPGVRWRRRRPGPVPLDPVVGPAARRALRRADRHGVRRSGDRVVLDAPER